MSIPLAETPTIGLGRFIKEARFSVPSHQRDYSWKEEYISAFLTDITQAHREKEDLYFCGLMVFLKNDSSEFQVLDGQQRLATTIMLISAVRNWLRKYSEYESSATKVQDRYLGDSGLDDDEVLPKLVLNSANNDYFYRFVSETRPISEVQSEIQTLRRGDRNKALLAAIVYVNSEVEKMASGFSDAGAAKSYLLDLVDYMTESVKIVRLIVSGDDQAYTIFETLNDRGMDLAPLDLVKNYLFSRAEKLRSRNGLRDLEERWTEMMTVLSNAQANSFLRAFWASRHGAPEGAKLFAPFKKKYKEPQEAYDASLELRAVAEHYVALSDPDDPVWVGYSDKARESVKALSVIGASQLYPVILAAIPKFDRDQMQRVLRLIEVIAVRYQLVARGRPGRMESLGGKTAKAISDNKITKATEVFHELRELYVADDVFQSDFETKYERESKKAVYLLSKLERQARLNAQDENPNDATPPSNITVEHILPKSPGDEWSDTINAYPEFHSDYLYRLGNLCLLADANRALGNKGFATKKATFEGTRLLLTSGVARYDDWTPDTVSSRQKWMAQLAVAEWRFQ